MAILRLKVGDRVVSCYSWSDLDRRVLAAQENPKDYGVLHPGIWSKNGRTGTVTELTRNGFGRIDIVTIKWDVVDQIQLRRTETIPLSAAIQWLHPIEHCNTCKHRLLRLGEGNCITRKYEMNHKAFVNKWRRRLQGKTENE